MPLEIMIHTVVFIQVAYQEGKIRSKGHQSANYGNILAFLQLYYKYIYMYMGITFTITQI